MDEQELQGFEELNTPEVTQMNNAEFQPEASQSKGAAPQPEETEIPSTEPEPTAQQTFPFYSYEPPKKRTGAKIGKFFAWVGIIAAVLAVCLICTNLIWSAKYNNMLQAYNQRVDVLEEKLENMGISGPATITPAPIPEGEGMLPAQVYDSCVNTVVAIQSTVRSQGFFGQVSESYSTGSGVILSPNGYIATNYHVVQGGYNITVVTYDNKEYEAALVGYDASNDIAVLKIEGEDFPSATIGSSDDLLVGDKVAAIGNPLGELTATMTVGYISAKDRLVSTDGTAINMLQTDAAINSGNSGGPLFNMYGQVVGITTAKYSGTSNSGASIEGIGFAIPINDVVDIIDDLMNYGYITGAYLGVYVRDMDSETASSYNLPTGAFVDDVTDGYCAKEAGVRKGDIIIALGGHKITCMADLTRALRKFNAGDTTTITVFRSGAEVHLPITLSEKPQETPVQQPEASMPQQGDYDEWYDYFFGQE